MTDQDPTEDPTETLCQHKLSDSGSVNYPHWGGCVSGVRVGRPLIERLVLGQDPKPQIAPEGCTISECMCVND